MVQVRPEEALMVLGFSSVLYLVLLFLVQILSRSLANNLLRSGLLTAVYSVWCGAHAAMLGANVHVQAGPAGIAVGEIAGPLGRIALMLVLGGLAVSIIQLWPSPVPAAPAREEGFRANL
jgi:hypothetical protein